MLFISPVIGLNFTAGQCIFIRDATKLLVNGNALISANVFKQQCVCIYKIFASKTVLLSTTY